MLSTPLVSPEELRSLAQRAERSSRCGSGLVLLDVRPGSAGRAAYHEEHLAGAFYADLDHDLADTSGDPRRGGRHPLPTLADWCATLGLWGITPATDVVCYDAASGALAAARAWWMLRAVGHRGVSVLDGGLSAAREAGLARDDVVPEPEPTAPYPADAWQAPTATLQQVASWSGDAAKVVVDARSVARFEGRSEPFDPVAGHIPGAVNLPYEELIDHRGRMLPRGALHERLARAGWEATADVVVHCGSGVTACQLCLAAEQAGLRLPSLYLGSWSEWCRNDLPVATVEADAASSGPRWPEEAR